MKVFSQVVTGLALTLALSGAASAATISGSLPLTGDNVTLIGGTDLSNSTGVSANPVVTSGAGTGDYSVVPTDTDFGPATLTIASISSGGGFTFNNTTYGTFTATSGTIITHTATNLDVFLLGLYSGLPSTCGSPCDPTGTLAHVSFNQSGDVVSEAITLTSPSESLPSGTPEPATVALIGSALVGLGFIRRRRKA
jgi:hypothetical protein